MQTKPFHLLGIFTFISIWILGADLFPAAGRNLQSPAADTTWQLIQTSSSPSGRYVQGMAFDSDRGVAVLFGGDGTGKQRLNDTWEYNGVNWNQIQTPTSPAGRVNISEAMVYDSFRHKIVLFGGLTHTGYMNDTWEYDGSTWIQVNTLVYPPGRDAHAMVYDPIRHVTVLFGGYSPSNPYFNDTWEYDGSTWRQVNPPQSPPGRHHFGMTYDSQRGVIVLFGGHSASSPQMADTWEYNGTTWHQITTPESPSPRESFSMAYDTRLGVVVLFGGTNNGVDPLNDTWSYNGANWSITDPTVSPSPRLGASLAYDSLRGKLVLFGGGYWTRRLNAYKETWEYGLDTGATNGITNEAQIDAGMPYDIYRGCTSPYVGCGESYHGFSAGVSTDIVLDAYKYGVDFNIKRELAEDSLSNPGRYLFGTPRYAEDLHRYFIYTQRTIPHQQPYMPGDIAFFDWDGNGLTDHVSIVTQVDQSGRPLVMIDATGFNSSNPLGYATMSNWSTYFDQHIQDHARIGTPLVSEPISTTADLPVLRIRLATSGASMRLQDGNGKTMGNDFDENLVASNVQDFIPYIPEANYAELSSQSIITVTNPRSNSNDYFVDLFSQTTVTYTLHIETLQNGIITDAMTYTDQTLPAGETQLAGIVLVASSGGIRLGSTYLETAPSIQLPAALELSGNTGKTLTFPFTISETGGLYPLQNASLTATDLADQMGGTIPAARLSLTSTNFNLSPGGTREISLQIDLAGFGSGLYQGSLQLTSQNSSPVILQVSLQVVPNYLYLPVLQK
jgi:hypothetical protein